MKKNIFWLLLSVALLSVSCNSADKLGKERIHDFSIVEAQFSEPGKDYRPAPLWTWNERINHDDIDRMLKDFKDQGFGGAFVHPRPGLITDYLSDDWFELWRYSVEKGKELGLDIWIYDENSYPSGFAGGHVQREMPESYDHPTSFSMQILETVPEDLSADNDVLLVEDGDTFTDITDEAPQHKDIKGKYYYFKAGFAPSSNWTGGRPYVDILYPGVTNKFIEITMDGYEKEFGDELGPVIKGIFTDEPHPHAFTPAMFQEFQKDWGYDLRTSLPSMFSEIGNWKQVRFHYWSTMLRLFIENWSEPWDRYCREKGLLWTGHYWEHGWPRLSNGMDNMAMYQFHRMPSIDMLLKNFDENSPYAQWGNIRSVKELRSVANQMGYTRTLCESYGAGGWDMTFDDFKRLADWEYAIGVNFMNQHYSNVTIEGARKFDHPDYFTGYSPWADDYKTLNDHVARLSLVLSQGDQDNDILILEPTTTAWMYYCGFNDPHVDEIGFNFTKFITDIEHRQLEYDLASENIISRHGSVRDGEFIIGEKDYSTVIIPEMVEVLLPRTAELLLKFARQGGHIIALSKPTLVNAYESDELTALWANGGANVSYALDKTVFDNDDIYFNEVSGGNLYHHRREYNDGDILFLANASATESTHGVITLNGKGLKELDTMTGEEYLYPCTVDDDCLSFEFDIPASGHLLLFAADCASQLKRLSARVVRSASNNSVEPASPMEVTRLSDNFLTLDYCNVTVDGRDLGTSFVADACRQLFAHFGMSNPWETAVQYKQEIVEADTLTNGVTDIVYQFDIAEEFDFSSLKFVCERPWLWTVSINGHSVSPIAGEHPLDARNGSYDIGSFVRKGQNSVVLHLDHMSVFAEIAHAFIAGDFSVDTENGHWTLKASSRLDFGPWPSQGMPFYSWTVAYSGKYDIADPSAGYILKLNSWEGTVTEVWVNGNKTGVIAYAPYETDITSHLIPGINEIEVRCIGSLVNLFGPHFVPRSFVMGPGSWYGSNGPHSSSDYIFNAYGLHEPFKVVLSCK